MTNLIAIVALVLPGGNPELKAEMQAFDRLQEQRAVERAKMRECWAREGLDVVTTQLMAAEKECAPFKAALRAIEVPVGGDPEGPEAGRWRAARDAEQSQPSCREERRLRRLWDAKNVAMEGCFKQESEKMDVRRAEFLEACRKCAAKERCEKSLRENEMTINGRLLLEESPERFSPSERAEVAREKPIYACQE